MVAQGRPPQVVFHGQENAVVSVLVADTPYRRAAGLMECPHLPDDAGMLFVFSRDESRDFWMKNTLIPLDQVYVRSDGTIVDIHKNAAPYSTAKYDSKPCKYVVEVNGGYCDRHGIRIGDTIGLID